MIHPFTKKIGPYVENELALAIHFEALDEPQRAFQHLEGAHVLGQESTYWHCKVHWLMFLWGLRNDKWKEVFGQALRFIAALILTPFKRLPLGNTGGSNVNPLKPMPLSEEHANILAKVKNS